MDIIVYFGIDKAGFKDMRWERKTMCKVYFSKKFRLERGKNTSEQKRGEILAVLYVLLDVCMCQARQPHIYN